jgi:RimJ/RimL family protein N-acetyltransferase
MTIPTLRTRRLELVPMTVDLCLADLSSPEILGRQLDADIPDAWPPELVTPDTLHEFIQLLNAPGGSRFYSFYWIKTGEYCSDRILIGSGGGLIKDDGIPEIGYSVLEEFRCQGYATEAVRAVTCWLKERFSPAFIRAYTFPFLTGSIRVLEKNGFHYAGPGCEEGTVEYRDY